jgi:uncharacterized protein
MLTILLLATLFVNAQTQSVQILSNANSATKVFDFDSIFTVEETLALDSLLHQVSKENGIAICVVSLDSSEVSFADLDTYSFDLARKWNSDLNNAAILIALSKGHRYIRIQNSFAIEKVLNDEETKEIIDNFIIPEFRKDHYFEGIKSGILQLENKISRCRNCIKCQSKPESILQDTTYPFYNSDRIIAYKFEPNGHYSTIKNGKFKLNIDEKVELTPFQTKELFNILFNLEPIPDTSRVQITRLPARCYIPHHTFVFYKDGKAFEFIEICLRCRNHKTNSSLYIRFCDDAWCELYRFLNDIKLPTEQDQMEKACK